MKNRSLVFIILFFCTLSIFSQESFVIRKTAKGIAEIIENKAEKELRYSVKDASKIYGKNQAENAIIKQSIKRSARERVFKTMKEEGMKSLLQYSNHRVGIKIANTGSSQYKRLINSNVAEYSNYNNRLKRSRVKNVTSLKKKYDTNRLNKRLSKTQIKKDLNDIIQKGPIKLSDKQIKELLEHPKDYLRAFIETYTGSNKNFQEFFIRLAMYDKKLVKRLLENPQIREYVDRSIRRSGEGGVHEWLMTKNFCDFLTNNKWGEDGPFLALALTRLVQKTENVIFKGGGIHGGTNSTKFHNGLSQIIDQCSSKEELFIAVRKYAKEHLTEEAYKEFNEIFKNVFLTAVS